jgi:predicted lysophospholipase L1 biosynthesis ABC-type transport system permease subunit
MHNAYVASDLLPAIAFWFVVVLAALPAFSIMRQSKRGRARSAIAYLAGFFFGLVATIGLSLALATWVSTPLAVFNAGAAAAFLGPFTGIVHGKLRRAMRRRPQPRPES